MTSTRGQLRNADRSVRPGHVLTVMCAGMFLVQLDVTVVNVALPSIGVDLGAGLTGLQWVVDAYAVALAALLLTGGALGDRYGHRRVVLTSLAGFAVASAGCGLAPTTGVLVAARAVQGVAAALLLPGTLAVITRTFPGRAEQARAVGIWAGISALALPTGPLLGGLLVATTGWRGVFWINLPVIAVALVATLRLVPADVGTRLRRLDLPGASLAALTLAALIYAVIEVGTGLGLAVWGAAVVAVLAGIAFLRVEARAAAPMLPLSLLRSSAFVGANAVAGLMNLVGIGTIFVTTLYLQGVQQHNSLAAGALLLPLVVPLAALSPVTGRLAARLGPAAPMSVGLVVGAIGSLGLLLVSPTSSYLMLLPALLGLGIGMGLLVAATVAAAMRSVPAERAGLASGVNNTARQAAGAVGVAIYGVLVGVPTAPAQFVTGLHHVGVLGAALWLCALVITVVTVGGRRRPD